MRVSRSGWSISVTRPWSRRLRKRSWSPARSRGRSVRGQHDLLALAVQRVVGVEDLLVERLAARLHELDVVDQQDVVLAIALVQRELRARLNRADEVVEERLGRDVEDLAARVVLLDVVADGVQEVGLAESGVAVDHQRIVGTTRGFSDRLGGGEREAVRRPGNEGVEGHARIESRGAVDAAKENVGRRRGVAAASSSATHVSRHVGRHSALTKLARSGRRRSCACSVMNGR